MLKLDELIPALEKAVEEVRLLQVASDSTTIDATERMEKAKQECESVISSEMRRITAANNSLDTAVQIARALQEDLQTLTTSFLDNSNGRVRTI